MQKVAVRCDGEYFIVGNMLIHIKSLRHYSLEMHDVDKDIVSGFTEAGKTTGMTETFTASLEKANSIIYISGPTGNLEEAEYIAFAATALLQSGGIGVKIETAGKAFEKDNWLELTNKFKPANLYNMFVVASVTDDQAAVYSRGMQNLGLKDTIIVGEDPQQAITTISVFSNYQITDKSIIQHKQVFSTQDNATKFNITIEKKHPCKGHQLLENPLGAWKLSKTI
ncbi:hypothetical protein FLA_2402 [Filimonas lacunae]|nr:hypothetical protein FLA_2402 [Filimonas lacunae]